MNAHEVMAHVEATFGTTFTPIVVVSAKGRVIGTNRVSRYTDDFRVVIAAPRPVGTYMRKRYHGWSPDAILTHAQGLADRQVTLRAQDPTLSLPDSLLAALRTWDPRLNDLERLWLNGAPYERVAQLMGLSIRQIQGLIDLMRGMGFDLPYRNGFSRRHCKTTAPRIGN